MKKKKKTKKKDDSTCITAHEVEDGVVGGSV